MGQKISIKIGDQVIGIADMEGASVIMTEEFSDGSDYMGLNIKISESSKNHPCMAYTTDVESLKLIFQNMTLRSSSLSNANLNDPMEKERVGVSKFADGRFITCFCQMDHECVPFWMYYGKRVRKNKVRLQFQNFAKKFEECIYTDYALVSDNKKCLFESPEFGKIVNSQWISGNHADEYDLRGHIDAILMFDVEYVPVDSEVFYEDNSGEAEVDFGKLSRQDNAVVRMKQVNPTVLGKQKSNPWDYEKETRILCVLSGDRFPDWKYIDLRLKPEMFRNLKITLSPWDDDTLRAEIETIISESTLPEDIKQSIVIEDSGLKGRLNFPENE